MGCFGDGFPWLVNEDVTYQDLYPLDPDKARSMLEEADFDFDGTVLRMPFDSGRPQMKTMGQ